MAKLTSKIALNMIERIEALKEQTETIYAEAREYDGLNNDRVIQDAVDARAAQREAAEEADAYISSFDADEDA